MEYFSQFNQDKFLFETFFYDKKKGFYLDIGAHDGVTGSNTYFFEKLGWDGICLEPIPSVFNKLKKNRNCLSLNVALSNTEGEEEFLVLEGYTEMLSGIIKNYEKKHLDRIESELKSMGGKKNYIKCKTIRFDQLELPETIDYVSLDVEGSELSILETIDFKKIKIGLISVENNYNDSNIVKIMLDNDFEVVKIANCDIIFKNKNL